jgi:hypothetical protein
MKQTRIPSSKEHQKNANEEKEHGQHVEKKIESDEKPIAGEIIWNV